MGQNMRLLLKILRLCDVRTLSCIIIVLLLTYPSGSFAQTPPPSGNCTGYTSACPSQAKVYPGPPAGCTQDGYPAFNGPADAGSIDGAPCPGEVWSQNGTNTYA